MLTVALKTSGMKLQPLFTGLLFEGSSLETEIQPVSWGCFCQFRLL